ncbi:MAG: hypothetical protein ACKOPQ_12105 [Novosphingobium sp.]
MRVNGWIVGLGTAIVLVSVAQAQVAPRTGTEVRLVANPEIAALRAEVTALKSGLASVEMVNKNQQISLLELKGELAKVKAELAGKSSNYHVHNVNGAISGKGVCGGMTSGAQPC